ncbi:MULTISPECIES: hypothetical protein [Pseudomonas]|uniref:hypothetical protein n=1 Tax=Pseudomonas TaxID=286 RepID=UPI001BE9A1EB|nr:MULTISPECIES: hypothetical protein [Pseudomonas]MBT2340961.1 hypothetical protein [Pseudomonas fluorescens]MCD4531400.1 hypothetical protein [Pseudomonas sp. C3-2018]
MSKAEADVLITYGRFWLAKAGIANNAVERDAIILHVNGQFNASNLPIRLGRGWQPHDPVIRTNNRCHRYNDVATWAAGHHDGGVAAAQLFRDWYTDDDTTLANLPDELKALAVITHLAEVGRGYVSALASHLSPWIDDICNAANPVAARALWQDFINRFPPSLTYARDVGLDYIP